MKLFSQGFRRTVTPCFLLLACLTIGSFYAATQRETAAQTEPTDPDRTFSGKGENRVATPEGTIRAQWECSRETLRLSDSLEMILTVDHAFDWEMIPLEFAETLGDFRVENVETMPLILREERQIHRFRITLTPEILGKCRVGAIPIVCQLPRMTSPKDAAVENDASRDESQSFSEQIFPRDEKTLLVPAFELDVRSSVSSETTLKNVFRPRGPQEIRNYRPYYVLGALATTLFLAYGVFHQIRIRRTVPVNTVQYTANQLAMRKLAILLDSRLHERDVKRFYMNLTTIVRWYIEQKTEIRAPELTTEEFLREMTLREEQENESDPTSDEFQDDGDGTSQDSKAEHFFFSAKNREILAKFLEVADLVKFARFQPSREEIMLGFRRASEFIELGNQFEDARLLTLEQTELLVTELQITGTHHPAAKTGTHKTRRSRTGTFPTDSHGTGSLDAASATGTQGTGTSRSAVFRGADTSTSENRSEQAISFDWEK